MRKPCIRCGKIGPWQGSRCPDHQRKAWATTTATRQRRGYGTTHQAIRRTLLIEHPICQLCGRRPSTIADHIINQAANGSASRMNYQALCRPCSDAKTQVEAQRGRR